MEETKKEDTPSTFQERADAFMEQYGELVKKYQIDMAALPVFVPNEQGTYTVQIQPRVADLTKQPIRSPLMRDDV